MYLVQVYLVILYWGGSLFIPYVFGIIVVGIVAIDPSEFGISVVGFVIFSHGVFGPALMGVGACFPAEHNSVLPLLYSQQYKKKQFQINKENRERVANVIEYSFQDNHSVNLFSCFMQLFRVLMLSLKH